ncbi:hypothetical protein TFLX_02541 [Thermoflexales bacterium]|nr:hypothetical protein TFLX_02541 [Thermoflexales bacterium]
MNRKYSFMAFIVTLVAALMLNGSGAIAQESSPQSTADLVEPVGPVFTYQGQLKNDGWPITGNCDFQFSLWDSPSNLTGQIGPMQARPGVPLNHGLFTVQLDFGPDAFGGEARWLEIAARCPAGSGSYITLTPRQPLTPTPYALYSSSTGALQDRAVAANAPGMDQVLKWNGTAWSPAADAIGLGDVTAVHAGTGLSGGGIGGDVTLSANFANNGISTTIARGDHQHWGQIWEGANFGLTLVVTQTDYANSVTLHANTSGDGQGTGIQGVVSLSGGDAFMVIPVGVSGISLVPAGGTTHVTAGVYGEVIGQDGFGVAGYGTYTGTVGFAHPGFSNGMGVYGEALGASGTGVYGNGLGYGLSGTGASGVWATSNITGGNGVVGVANNGSAAFGVWGQSSSGYAGYFSGNVHVTGDLSAGGTKPFKIDNPLDPQNQYLYHYAVESPQVQNVYNGTVVLDTKGEATIQLPAYFSAVNTGDYRYYLTAMGAPMPNLYIAEEVQGNTFKIAGGVAGKKVSWMVYSQRNDPWVRDHPQLDVVNKPEGEAGTYLYPQGYGQPESRSLDYAHTQQLHTRITSTSTKSLSTPVHSPWILVQPSPAQK